MNIQLAINEGANILKDKEIQTAKLDTEILMSKVLDKDRKYVILNNTKELQKKNFEYLGIQYIYSDFINLKYFFLYRQQYKKFLLHY